MVPPPVGIDGGGRALGSSGDFTVEGNPPKFPLFSSGEKKEKREREMRRGIPPGYNGHKAYVKKIAAFCLFFCSIVQSFNARGRGFCVCVCMYLSSLLMTTCY